MAGVAHAAGQHLATDGSRAATVIGYLAAAALRAAEGAAAAAAHHAADAAVVADGAAGALERELEWQARWIGEHAGLAFPMVASV